MPKLEMKKGRDVILTIALISAFVLMLLPLSSAGFFSDLWGQITGKATSSGVSLNISVATISIVNVSNPSSVTINLGPNPTTVQTNFTAYHGAGATSINSSTGTLNFSKSGEAIRQYISCINTSNGGGEII